MTWRQGTQAALSSRFAALRVRPAHRDETRAMPWPEEWLLVEWPEGAEEPAKHWLSNLPPRTALKRLVHTAKARWRIERDYQDLKQEIGFGHYEGRGWRGFHHHASLCIAAYGFLVAERCLSPPSSPLRPGLHHATCTAPRLPAARRRCGLSATWRPPSPRFDAVSRSPSSARCPDAHVA